PEACRGADRGSDRSAVPQDLCGPADGAHLEVGHAARAAACGAQQLRRYRICAGPVGPATDCGVLPGQSWQGRGGPGGAELQSYSRCGGANRTAMRLVIKLAGALLEDQTTVRSLAGQVAQLARRGHEILVVHGGGRVFTATLKRLGIESKFVA